MPRRQKSGSRMLTSRNMPKWGRTAARCTTIQARFAPTYLGGGFVSIIGFPLVVSGLGGFHPVLKFRAPAKMLVPVVMGGPRR